MSAALPAEARAVALRYLTDRAVTLPDLERIFGLSYGQVLACLAAELVPLRVDRSRCGWSDADIDLVRRMAAAGWNEYRAAAQFGVAARLLVDVLRGRGVDLVGLWPHRGSGHRGSGPRKPEQRDAVIRLFRGGETDVARIAVDCGVSENSVRRWLLTAGFVVPRKPVVRRPHPGRAAAVDRFRAGGVSEGWLAAEYAVSRTTVRNWLQAEGLVG